MPAWLSDGYANRRINITMFSGRRRVHEGLAAQRGTL
jgi:hypothetical protein